MATAVSTALQQLKHEGWSLNEDAVLQHLDDQPTPSSSLDKLRAAILNLDLKQVGVPSLPDDVNRGNETKKINGPYVLQLVEAIDIAQPCRLQDVSTTKRLLRLRLTDGSRTCTAIEYNQLPTILKKSSLIPGTKVKLDKEIVVRSGCLLLDSGTKVSVLGGRVERLAAAYETQQMYGMHTSSAGTDTDATTHENAAEEKSGGGGGRGAPAAAATTAKKEDKERPPPFKLYDPKEQNQSSSSSKAALASISVPTVSVVGPVSVQKNRAFDPGDTKKNNTTHVAGTTTTHTNSQNTNTTNSKLLERLAAHEDERSSRWGGGGRGRGRGRGRRHRGGDDSDSDGDGQGGKTMTMEEWEEKQRQQKQLNASGSGGASKSDEELARQLQRQLDLEDARNGYGNEVVAVVERKKELESSLVMGMFGGTSGGGTTTDMHTSAYTSSRGGRGRGRGSGNRGGRSGGRGRSGGGSSAGRSRGRARGRGGGGD